MAEKKEPLDPKEWIRSMDAIALSKDSLFGAITLPTLHNWIRRYKNIGKPFGKKRAGRWFVHKEKFLAIANGEN